MNKLTLHDYIAAQLPEPVDAERLAFFFAQADVVSWLSQMDELTAQLIACWQQLTPPIPNLKSLNEERLTTATEDSASQSVYSFQEITTHPTADGSAAVAVHELDLVSALHDITHNPESSIDTVRFTPTQSPGSSANGPLKMMTIANATVGKSYAYTFDFGAMGLPELSSHSVAVDAITGLQYDAQSRTIHGTPVASGEFEFVLTYHPKTDELDRPALTRRIHILVNPDPRSLWKDLPSDTHDPYYKPDSDQDLLVVGDVRLVGASVRGRSHAHEGKFRDDDFSLAYLADPGWYVLSVADGAGSARFSRRGSQLACHTVTQFLESNVEPSGWELLTTLIDHYARDRQESLAGSVQRQLYDVLGKAVFAAYKAIEREAQTKSALLKDYATTLITVLAKPIASGWFIGAFWVGDGGVGIYRTEGELLLLGTPDGGEYAGQTRFLTMPETIATDFFGRFRFALVPDFTAVVLMTDGVTDPKFQTDNNLSRKEKWDELWSDLQQNVSFTNESQIPAQLQNWLNFWSPGNHDDRTITLLYTHAGNPKN